MKAISIALAAAVALGLAAAPASAAELAVGDKAPALNLESTAGGRYALGDRAVERGSPMVHASV